MLAASAPLGALVPLILLLAPTAATHAASTGHARSHRSRSGRCSADGGCSGIPDIRGTYEGGVCTSGTLADCIASPQYPHTKVIEDENLRTGEVSGPGYTGQINGCTLTIHVTDGDYKSTEVERISKNGKQLRGTFHDSNGQSGPDFDNLTDGDVSGCPPCDTDSAKARRAGGSAKQGCDVTLSGTVRYRVCGDDKCRPRVTGRPNKVVEVSGDGKTKRDRTNAKGQWSVRVRARKKYTVRVLSETQPEKLTVTPKKDVGGLDFMNCEGDKPELNKYPCDVEEVDGKILDTAGAPYSGNTTVGGQGDRAYLLGGQSDFTLYLPKGRQRIEAGQLGFPGVPTQFADPQVARDTFNVNGGRNAVKLTARPAFVQFEKGIDTSQVTFAAAGLPGGLSSTLSYDLTGPQAASCIYHRTGTVPLGADGHTVSGTITPDSFLYSFCPERMTLTISNGSTTVASEQVRILS